MTNIHMWVNHGIIANHNTISNHRIGTDGSVHSDFYPFADDGGWVNADWWRHSLGPKRGNDAGESEIWIRNDNLNEIRRLMFGSD